MDNAALDLGLRKDRFQSFWEARHPIHAGDEAIVDASLLELRKNGQPKFRAVCFTYPQSQEFVLTGEGHAQGDVDRFRLDGPLMPRLHKQTINVQNGIDRFQGAALPQPPLFSDRSSDRRNQRGGDVSPIELFQMTLNLPRGHPMRIES